jgi:carotenoid cleavage dioxygenase
VRRRQFLLALAAAGAAPSLFAAAADPWRKAFDESVAQRPWLLGYRGVDQPCYRAEVPIEGRWPAALSGVFYRNGPGQQEIGDYRYRHWFDGDGLVQRFAVHNGRLHHRARLVHTHKRQREAELGRAALPTFGSTPPDALGVTGPDDLNPANISVLAHGDRLLALWEAGSAWALDPQTLETLGPHAFSEDTRGLPFSAHPRRDRDGSLWNFGYGGRLLLWHLGPDGALRRIKAFDLGDVGMPHDFILTPRYVVLLLPPLLAAAGAGSDHGFLGTRRWQPERGTRVLVIDKADLRLLRELELPAQWVFHFGNGYEESEGVIRFDAARYPDPGIMQDSFRAVMRGTWEAAASARWTEYRIDLRSGRITESPGLDEGLAVEFPRISPQDVCRQHQRVVLLSGAVERRQSPGELNCVSCWHRRTDRLDSYRFPETHLVEEHILIPEPRGGADAGGWILGTALDCVRGRTELNLFDADELSAGPIARSLLPYAMPLGFHGTYSAGVA